MKKAFTLVLATSFLSQFISAATFTSVSNGDYNNPVRWSVVGSDADGIPDANDDVILNNTVSLFSAGSARNITVNPGRALVLNNYSILIYGNLINNGTVAGAATSGVQFLATGTFSGNPISANAIYFYQNYTVASGAGVSYSNIINVSNSRTVTNNGSILTHGLLSLGTGALWINANGSSLTVDGISNTGVFNASAATNTVTYWESYTSLKCIGATYNNLTLQTTSPGIKSLTGSLNVTGNLTLSTGVTLNWANNSINLGGDWTNNANTTCNNMASLDFNGSGTQTISRSTTEVFNHISTSGTGTVVLARDIRVNGDVKFTAGVFDVSASNFAMEVRGNWTNNGTFNARQGTVSFTRTSSPVQQIDGSSTTQFYNLTSANTGSGVNVVGPATLANILTVSTGVFGTSGTGTLTLLASGVTTYARIAPVLGSLTGNGWRVQAYINGPATAYWQYLSTPINGNKLSDWDLDTRFYMSGVGGNDGNACCPIFYSVRTYNTASNTYTNITSSNTTITNGKGYMVWMADNMNSLTAPLVYDSRGVPNFGNKTISVTAGGSGSGYNLVGNPYACPIDYTSVQTASGNIGGSFMILQENGSYATNPNGGVIAPNQGFLCQATSSGNMTFTESCKNIASTPGIMRIGDPNNFVRIDVRSVMTGLGGQAVVSFQDNSTKNNDLGIDLPFIASPYELAANIWTTGADNSDLLMNVDPAEEDELTIPLYVEPAVFGQHDITFQGINGIDKYTCAKLEDPSTGQVVDLGQVATYSFVANSTGRKKFLLHFKRSQEACTLAESASVLNLDGQTLVFANAGGLFAKFNFNETTDVRISVYNMLGQEVTGQKQAAVANETIQLDVPQSHGIYLVRIQSGDQETTKKIYY